MPELKKRIRAIGLSNGLLLELYDLSRKIAGDRWQIGMLARIDIPLDDALIALIDHHPEDLPAFREASRGTVRFEQKRERNFIDAKHREQVLQNLIDMFLQSAFSYLSHPDFPKKVVLRKYKEHVKRKTWYPDEEKIGEQN